jgi:hypothetical protein
VIGALANLSHLGTTVEIRSKLFAYHSAPDLGFRHSGTSFPNALLLKAIEMAFRISQGVQARFMRLEIMCQINDNSPGCLP